MLLLQKPHQRARMLLSPSGASTMWEEMPFLCDLDHSSLTSLSVHLGIPQIESLVTMMPFSVPLILSSLLALPSLPLEATVSQLLLPSQASMVLESVL